MEKQRGFEEVAKEHKKYGKKVSAHGTTMEIYPPTHDPIRADPRSAGYDFSSPIDVMVLPGQSETIWTNIKAYMQDDEVLELYIRSSLGIKQGLILANTTGIVDASYYENDSNDGNIGICIKNTTGQAKEIKAGDRIAQGIFKKYLITDNDKTLADVRTGGTGSSGK